MAHVKVLTPMGKEALKNGCCITSPISKIRKLRFRELNGSLLPHEKEMTALKIKCGLDEYLFLPSSKGPYYFFCI